MTPDPRLLLHQVSSRERVIGALAREINVGCGCDGCLVDAAVGEVVKILREQPLGEPAHAPAIRADDWAANFIANEVLRV